MKKIISLALVAVMLVSMIAVNVSAANTYIPKAVEVPMFTKSPDIDGTISREEWVGEPSVTFSVAEASKQNADGVSAQNVYFDTTYTQLDEATLAQMKTELWFRYDADYLYVAAIVYDPTGNINECPNGNELWNGDNIQFKFDPQGPNSAMKALDPNFDWTTTPFSNEVFPTEVWDAEKEEWRAPLNNEYKPYWFLNCDKLADYTAAYVSINDTPVVFNNTDPHIITDLCAMNVKPTTDDEYGPCETHYEFRFPWSEIYKEFPNLSPTAGTALGIVVGVTENYGVTNAESWRYYDSCYSWGTGLYGGQAVSFPDTIGGTNAIVLLGEDTARTPYVEYVPPVVDDGNGNVGEGEGTGNGAGTGTGTGTGDGAGTGTGNGVADKNPQTGDSILFVTLLAAACVAVVAVITKKRRACNK